MRKKTSLYLALSTGLLLVACSPEPVADKHAGHAHAKAAGAHAGHADASKGAEHSDGCCPAPGTKDEAICGEHNVPEEECGICNPDRLAQLKPGQGMKVRLGGTNSAAIAGIETAAASIGPIAEGLDCYAEINFNLNSLAQIAAPVAGIIRETFVDLGSNVTEKQPVAKIWSASIAEGVAKAVLSHQTLQREQKLRAERVNSAKDLQEAEAEHRAACQQLRTLGFTEEQIDELGAKPQEEVLMEVRAPFAGEVIERTAVRGSLVEVGKTLYTIADRSVMWAELNIPESALGRVKLGQPVELTVESLPGQVFSGKLAWIGPSVDERTRMARARAEVPNPEGLLKARMFANARILVRAPGESLSAPASSVQLLEGKPFVFVKLGDDLFEVRAVRTGSRWQGRIEVVDGLKAGEELAAKGVFSLKSALLISRLGAGCADD